MNVGTAQVNITPRPGIDLAGFAVRAQPSTRVLDPLWVRVLYVESGTEKLLWIHGDVLAFDETFVKGLHEWAWQKLAIPAAQIIVAATHTHSGPATIQLTGCGQVDAGYVRWLETEIHQAVLAAVRTIEPCSFTSVEGRCHLGVDRLKPVSNHTDPRVPALAWRKNNGSFKAVVLAYAMHPVCLNDAAISGDWPGETARCVAENLPGNPMVIISSGACGNINPPAVGVSPEQTYAWGAEVAKSVLPALLESPVGDNGAMPLKTMAAAVPLPLESWTRTGIENHAAKSLADMTGKIEFGESFGRAISVWRENMLRGLDRHEPATMPVQLGVLSLGRITILTVNAEVFSRFSELTNLGGDGPVYAIGCVNGMIGYLPSAEAYDKDGYEVSWSMFFYNQPRLKKGGLELLAKHARQLARTSALHPAGRHLKSSQLVTRITS